MELIDLALYLAYFLILVALVAALGFTLKYLFQHLSEAKGTFIGIGAMALVLILGYAFASPDYSFKGMEAFNISQGTVKMVGGGINSFFILLAIAIISTLYFEVVKFIK